MKAQTEVKTKEETKVGHININNLGEEVQMDQEIKTIIRYVPTTLPPNTNPIYNFSAIDINKKYLKKTLGVVSVWSLSQRYKREMRICKSWWSKSNRSCRQTLEQCFGGARVETFTIGHYHKTHFLRGGGMWT